MRFEKVSSERWYVAKLSISIVPALCVEESIKRQHQMAEYGMVGFTYETPSLPDDKPAANTSSSSLSKQRAMVQDDKPDQKAKEEPVPELPYEIPLGMIKVESHITPRNIFLLFFSFFLYSFSMFILTPFDGCMDSQVQRKS